VAREHHPLDRALALLEGALELAAPGAQPPGFLVEGARLGLQRGEGAVGLRDGPLGAAQRVARFLLVLFLLLQLRGERVDAAAQRPQVFFSSRGKCGKRKDKQQESDRLLQVFAFPWLATEATRFAISSASPR
jgi:hypothetical protein